MQEIPDHSHHTDLETFPRLRPTLCDSLTYVLLTRSAIVHAWAHGTCLCRSIQISHPQSTSSQINKPFFICLKNTKETSLNMEVSLFPRLIQFYSAKRAQCLDLKGDVNLLSSSCWQSDQRNKPYNIRGNLIKHLVQLRKC